MDPDRARELNARKLSKTIASTTSALATSLGRSVKRVSYTNNPGGPDGEMIDNLMKEGKLVPSDLLVRLIKKVS